MSNKFINGVEITEFESSEEQLWFSHLKQLAKKAKFGKIELSLTINNGKIVNIKNTRVVDNFNIREKP